MLPVGIRGHRGGRTARRAHELAGGGLQRLRRRSSRSTSTSSSKPKATAGTAGLDRPGRHGRHGADRPALDPGHPAAARGLYDYLQGVQAYLAPPIFVVFFLGVFHQAAERQGLPLGALWPGFASGLFRLAVDTPVKLSAGILATPKGPSSGS
ncbi:MAG: hypothetical protein MZV63_46895 [Marinilabiliales bacterium]|nr:hypothetical protein [Marinilabiliales bacterium]